MMVNKNIPVEVVLQSIVPHSDIRSMVALGRVNSHYYDILIENWKGLWYRRADADLSSEQRFLAFMDGSRILAHLKSSLFVSDWIRGGFSPNRDIADLTFSDCLDTQKIGSLLNELTKVKELKKGYTEFKFKEWVMTIHRKIPPFFAGLTACNLQSIFDIYYANDSDRGLSLILLYLFLFVGAPKLNESIDSTAIAAPMAFAVACITYTKEPAPLFILHISLYMIIFLFLHTKIWNEIYKKICAILERIHTSVVSAITTLRMIG